MAGLSPSRGLVTSGPREQKRKRVKKKKVQFTVEVTGESAIQRFRNLIELFGKLGSWGCSRSVVVEWDGDGPDKLSVIEAGGVEPNFSKEDLEKATNYNEICVWTDGISGEVR
jgi:hypothetical protein